MFRTWAGCFLPVLAQLRRYAGTRLTIHTIDVDKQRDQARLLAKKYKIGGEDLQDGVVARSRVRRGDLRGSFHIARRREFYPRHLV